MESWGLGPDLEKRWRTLAAYHGCMDIAIADVDADGAPEIVLGNKYGSVYALRQDGSVLLRSYTSIGDVAFGLADLDGDGRLEVVHGSSTGDLVAVTLKDEVLWRFDNFGYAVRRVLIGRVGTPLAGRCYVASASGYVYGLDKDGDVVWQRPIGSDVVDLAACDYGRWTLCALDRSGAVHLLTADGADDRLQACPTQAGRGPAETWGHLLCLPDRIVAAGTSTVIAYPRP